MHVLVTGLAQGDDPSGGVAVATALRQGFDELRLVGQDYSSRATGLHHPVFDEVVVHRPWGEFDTDALRSQLVAFIDQGCRVISTIDLEGYWLARHFEGRPEILSPPSAVYTAVAKPPRTVPQFEGLRQPPAIPMSATPSAVHAFLRAQGWRAWLKGPFHDALRVPPWEELDALTARSQRHWPFEGAHLQAHIDGIHEAAAFAAHRGRLLDAIWIVKNDMTAAGKTIAASRREIQEADRKALADYVAALDWTGGGEIELIRDQDGTPWLIEINPRFPAWISGAALLGVNLPAMLLEATTGVPHRRGPRNEGFVRVQREIATRRGYDLLPPLILNPDEPLDSSKVAFNIHELAHHIDETVGLPVPSPPASDGDGDTLPDLEGIPVDAGGTTPGFHLLTAQLRRNLANTARVSAETAGDVPDVMVAYSVKTNPDHRVLTAVREAGFGAEVTGVDELRHTLACGFPPERIIFTGTGKAGDVARVRALHSGLVFADSLAEVESLMRHAPDRPLGLRLRPAGFQSRFGIPLESAETVDRLFDLLDGGSTDQPLAVHFHLPHALIGARVWRAVAEAMLDQARMFMDVADRRILCLDVGGGFYPDDFEEELAWICGPFRERAQSLLPHLARIIVEPGRALVQNAFAVETTLLEVRDEGRARDVVVDAALADLPEAGHYPHRVCLLREGRWSPLPRGRGMRVLGRTCMEDDVLIRAVDLSGVGAGDRLLILDAGSYDRSMAYEFGRGKNR